MAFEDNINHPDMADILKKWGKENLTHKDVSAEEKRLTNAFEEAVKNGADPKVLGSILNEWKDSHDQLNQMESVLFNGRADGEEPDVFQEYIHKSKENLARGMNTLTGKTKEFIGKVKEGLANGGQALTNKIKNAHENVMSVFHGKQADLTKKFDQFLGNVKGNIRDNQDFARVNRWVGAVQMAEEAKLKASESKEERISKLADKISGQTKEQLAKNAQKFEKTVQNADQPSFSSRIKAGAKTITDAIQGKEYKEYSANKDTQEAANNLKSAQEKLKKSDARAIAVGNIKLGIVKAWTNLTVSFNQFKANQYEKMADLSRQELGDIENPQAKTYKEQIESAMKDGMSMDQAVKHVAKMNEKPGQEFAGKDANMSKEPKNTPDFSVDR